MDRLERVADKIGVGVTRTIDRRVFFRKAAATTFKAVAVLSAGGALAEAFAIPAWANDCSTEAKYSGNNGAGCPKVYNVNKNGGAGGYMYPCGPSPCCSSASSSSCDCANGTTCLTQSQKSNCRGADNTSEYWSSSKGTACWSCVYTSAVSGSQHYVCTTTCCDCKRTSACATTRCIGWSLNCKWITA
jgi:hypothetical protein